MYAFILGVLILWTYTDNVVVSEQELFHTTKGAVWPKPAQQKQEHIVHIYDAEKFKFDVTHHNCKLIEMAISRCNKSMIILKGMTKREEKNIYQVSRSGPSKLAGLRITLQMPCENYPHRKMDENYYLKVSKTSQLTSNSIWGIIRGLETFSQLFCLSKDNRKVFLWATTISDKPRYAHRGLMLDTSLHYIEKAAILNILNGMAMNKLNVFHWRFVDFKISEAGHYEMMYSKKEIRKIIQHAKALAIRVVPEFGLPLHAGPGNNSQSMNPLNKLTYSHLRDFYKDIQELFPDQYLHLGDVDLSRWTENPKVKAYMESHHSNMAKLHKLCLKTVQSVIRYGTTPVVWQSSKDIEANLPVNFIIETQKKSWMLRGVELIKKGRQIISSIYLSRIDQLRVERSRFEEYYTENPRTRLFEITQNHTLDENIIGLEAVIGADVLDGLNIFNSTWLHIAAIAEVLWSLTDGTMPDGTLNRMREHDCRLNRQGIHNGSTEFCMHSDEDSIPEILKEKKKGKLNVKPIAERDVLEWRLLVSSLVASVN